MTLRLRCGIDWKIEEQALALLVRDRKAKGVAAEYSWLTDEQLELRQRREVYNITGAADVITEGRVFRAWNPLFGSRPKGLVQDFR